jgi:cysteine desulfurase/selenocysteine lyase
MSRIVWIIILIKMGAVDVSPIDVKQLREEFPILSVSVHGKPLVYLDNGATTQKPRAVINSLVDYYSTFNANIHRGVHSLSQEASAAYEQARESVAQFIHATSAQEIVFTRGTTESINLVAHSFLSPRLREGDTVVISGMEHHSNILPWQVCCDQAHAQLNVVQVLDDGTLDLNHLNALLEQRPKMLAITHVSNTLGTINPIKSIVRMAKEYGVPVLVDGAQAVPHMRVDVCDLDCDFYVFSGHKMYGPTGIGVLYAKGDVLNEMTPYQTGGGIIKTVAFDHTEYVTGALKFEAGTPNIEGAIGLAAAIKFVTELGMEAISQHEMHLHHYARTLLKSIDGVRFIGEASDNAGVISFVVEGTHPFDVGTILDQQGVAVRTGHHCTQPLMERFNVPGTVRVSFGVYNTKEEVDVLIAALKKAIKMLK